MKVKKSSHKKDKKSKNIKVKNGESSKPSETLVNINNFKLIKMIGCGAQGKVFIAEKLDGPDAGKIYAIKIQEREMIKSNKILLKLIRNERKFLELVIDCPFITKMAYAFQSVKYIYIVMEFEQGGDMFHALQTRTFSLHETRFFIAEIILALEELHKLNILYRDLKPENILFDKEGHVVVTDFGLSYDLSKIDHEKIERIAGTTQYMPPEILDETMPYGFAVDWWAVGVMTHEMMTLKLPFHNFIDINPYDPEKMKEMLDNVTISIDESIDEDARDFISKLLVKDVKKRLGSNGDADELKNHPFLKRIDFDLLRAKEFKSPIANIYLDKYDTNNFETSYTETPLDFSDNSPQNYISKTFPHFSYIAPALKSNKNTSTSMEEKQETQMKQETKDETKMMRDPTTINPVELMNKLRRIKMEKQKPNFGIKRIGNRTILRYIPNNKRPSWIIQRCDYKK